MGDSSGGRDLVIQYLSKFLFLIQYHVYWVLNNMILTKIAILYTFLIRNLGQLSGYVR